MRVKWDECFQHFFVRALSMRKQNMRSRNEWKKFRIETYFVAPLNEAQCVTMCMNLFVSNLFELIAYIEFGIKLIN